MLRHPSTNNQLALLVESTNDRIKTGMVKLLQSIQHTINYNQHQLKQKMNHNLIGQQGIMLTSI